MKAQLDEIERTMAQLSPRMLSTELEDEDSFGGSSSNNSLSLSPGKLNIFPPTPRSHQHSESYVA